MGSESRIIRFLLTVTVVALAIQTLRAQTSQPMLPDAPSTTVSQQSKDDQAPQPRRTFFGIVPPNRRLGSPQAPPLSPKQKAEIWAKDSADPFQFIVAGFDAAISQASNDFKEYGQGWDGYGKRYGASMADQASGKFFGTFLLPVIFHEDPRYYRLESGTNKERVTYALSRAVVGRTDSGRTRFNFSNIGGNIAAGALANAYYPPGDRGVGLTFARAAGVTASGALQNVLTEFLPDVRRWWKNRKK